MEERNYVFEIRLNEYNSDNGLQNYIATKVFEKKTKKKRYNTKLIVHIYQVNKINNNYKVKKKLA